MKQRIVALAALITAVLLLGSAGAAQAQTRTVDDGPGEDQQSRPYRLSQGTFTYTDERTVLKAHVQRVVKKRTWVGAHVYYPDDSHLWLRTFHRNNGTKVTAARYFDGDTSTRVRANSRWNYQRDTVTFVVNNVKQDPKPGNNRASFDLYTVTKGWQHGPICQPEPIARSHASARATVVAPKPVLARADTCNDDYVFTRLRR